MPRRDAVTRSMIERCREASVLPVGGHVDQLGQLFQLRYETVGP